MKLKIAYGRTFQEIEINPHTSAVLSLPSAKRAAPLAEIIDKAVLNPNCSLPLPEFLKDCQKLLVIVNDSARGIPTAQLLEHLCPCWQHLDVKYIVATGAHRCSTEAELKQIFGPIYHSERDAILVHAAEKDNMISLGKTSFGTPVKFNAIITKVDKIINLNSVEPHYFAGYTGGRKSFMPGIAAYETIEHNHSLALSAASALLKLQDNPVHEDMLEAVGRLDTEIFSVNTVLNGKNEVVFAAAGNWKTSFSKAVKEAENTFLQTCPHKADIVVAVVRSPLDEDLYQAQKGIENCRKVLNRNGIMILVAACPGGIGKDQFYQLLTSCRTPQEVFRKIEKSYKLGYHKAARLADLQTRHDLWMVTDIPSRLLEKINIRKFSSVKVALMEAILRQGKAARIIINPDAGMVVPLNPSN